MQEDAYRHEVELLTQTGGCLSDMRQATEAVEFTLNAVSQMQ